MDARESEEFDLGIYLAKHDQEQAANFIFNRLLENHPDNIYLMTLCAFTASTPDASAAAIERAMRLDPTNPLLLEARVWLEDYYRAEHEAVAPGDNSPLKVLERAHAAPHVTAIALNSAPRLAARPFPVASKPKQPDKIPTATKTILPANHNRVAVKPRAASFSGLWWVLLGCSLIFFGVAIALFYMVVVADSMTEPEKTYLSQVSQLEQQTGAVIAELNTAIDQFNAGKLKKAELEKYYRHLIGQDEKYRLLKSPSGRFARLNGLLSQAYDYFNRGAVNLIMAINANDARQVNEGSRLLGLGNDYLRQGRDELKKLGG